MDPRDIFDACLLVVLVVTLFVEQSGTSFSTELLQSAIHATVSLDLAVYLVIGGVLGVAYVGYIAVYLPRKQTENAPR